MIRTFKWEEWKDWSVLDVMSNVKDRIGFEPMGEMTFSDALWSQEGMGIYCFYKDDYVPLYIGKVASRSFLERISGHLDTHTHKGGSSTGWFNTFQQRWVEHFNHDDHVAKRSYLSSVAFNTFQVPASNSPSIPYIEKLMLHYLDPALNRGTKIGKKSKYHPLLESSTSSFEEVGLMTGLT